MNGKKNLFYLTTLLTALMVAMGGGFANASDYPTKPIRLIAPNEPGGPTDILARTLAQKLSVSLGQSVIVENRAAPALIDLVSGQIHVMFATALSVKQHIQSGKVRPLAVTTATRSAAFPDLPTIAEAGVPGFDATTWHGLFAPAGTPTEIVSRLNADVNLILQMPDVRKLLESMGADIKGGTSRELGDHVQSEIAK
jgi:tripartite-type tricarboxylate transporter receptor subunit TctC